MQLKAKEIGLLEAPEVEGGEAPEVEGGEAKRVGHTELWRKGEGPSPRALRGSQLSLMSDFHLQNCERTHFHCFKPPQFVTATLEN
jgi:hypothetical protein